MSSGLEQCPICQAFFRRAGGGITNHKKACIERQQRALETEAIRESAFQGHQAYLRRTYEEEMNSQASQPGPSFSVSDAPDLDPMDFEPTEPMDMPQDARNEAELEETEDMEIVTNPLGVQAAEFKSHIKIHYHPRVGIAPKEVDPSKDTAIPVPAAPLLSPFAPFPSKADFLIAERMVNTSASQDDINFILKMHRDPCYVNPGESNVRFRNAKQLHKCVDAAADLYPGFTQKSFEIPYTLKDRSKITLNYSLYVKDVMPWIEELVGDPTLKDHWTWHAKREFIHMEGKEPERFITTPMTADYAWEIEGTLPPDKTHVQFPLIYYSDKSNAARFAQFSLWPVLLRPANLPKELANQNSSYSGNTLFALLPKIEHPAGDLDNPSWPTTARVIYHKCCEIMFGTFSEASHYGKTMHCGDTIDRTLHPGIAIAEVDLEEQFLCAAHQGTNASHPCPKCLVKNQDQSNLMILTIARSHHSSQEIIKAARKLIANEQTGASVDLLRTVSLYLVNNAWWCLGCTDVHRALSFDVLHTIWLGLWGAHLLPLLMHILVPIDEDSRNRHLILTERIKNLPSFPGLLRILQLGKFDFADGKTYFSILQQILPLVHDLVPPKYHPLLRLSRTLAEIALHAQMKMQTESRLRSGEALIAQFNEQLPIVSQLMRKNFNFPKAHQLSHLFNDIRQKGTADYLNCMVGENFHQGLIKAYEASNGRDAIKQILRSECRILALSRIRWRLNIIDRYYLSASEEDQEDCDDLDNLEGALDQLDLQQESAEMERDNPPFDLIPLGSVEKPGDRDSAWIERNGGYFKGFTEQAEFKNFHKDLNNYLKILKGLYRPDFQMPPEFDDTAALLPYRNIKHSYVSFDDQLLHQENIRCSPIFFARTRFDTVLVRVGDSYRPARLHLVFEIAAYGVQWQLARVTFFSALRSVAIDRTIGMHRYHEEEIGEFFHLASIIRSCYMTPIFTEPRQFYLNDLVAGDVDLFLRLN